VTRGGAGYAAGHTVSSESATRINAGQTQAMASPSFSSEAKTLVAGEATKVATVAPGAVSQARGRQGLGGWIAAGILLLVLVGGAAGFLAYRARHQSTQTEAERATPSEPQTLQSSQPVRTPTAAPTEAQTAKTNKPKPEKTKTESAPKGDATMTTSSDRPAFPPLDPNRPPPRGDDQTHDPNRSPNPNGFPRRTEDQFRPLPPPDIRVMRNGARVVKQPDGSFVMIMPNGATRVFVPPKPHVQNQNQNPNKNKP